MPRVNLTGSSAVVTGGASGIGEASARQLAEAGSKVVTYLAWHLQPWFQFPTGL